jgi:hypothetical protein
MKAGFVALASLLLLGACGKWNEQAADYATYADFQAGKYASSGHLPSNLVPASAHAIRVVYNIDSTEIDVAFDFAPADADRMITPFLSTEQILIREHEREGSAPAPHVQSPMFVRCTVKSVEFLQITDMARAHYWTSLDPTLRQTACRRADGGPLISI